MAKIKHKKTNNSIQKLNRKLKIDLYLSSQLA